MDDCVASLNKKRGNLKSKITIFSKYSNKISDVNPDVNVELSEIDELTDKPEDIVVYWENSEKEYFTATVQDKQFWSRVAPPSAQVTANVVQQGQINNAANPQPAVQPIVYGALGRFSNLSNIYKARHQHCLSLGGRQSGYWAPYSW